MPAPSRVCGLAAGGCHLRPSATRVPKLEARRSGDVILDAADTYNHEVPWGGRAA
jgi:hypothetical protein